MKRLLALLDSEKKILKRGDLDQLETITAQKDQLTRDLDGLRLSVEDINTVRNAAQQNANLLAAAIAGVREARARLAEMQDIQAGLNIYTSQGDRQTVASQQRRLERKA